MTATHATRTTLLLAAIAIVAIGAGIMLSRTLLRAHEVELPALTHGTLLTPPRALPPLDLVDQHDQAFTNARLQGRTSLLFFGFTNCPDVCPNTLALLAQVGRQLADLPDAQRPQVILVSVDPRRDTPAQLLAYLKSFNPEFVGLTGTPQQIDALTRHMSVPLAVSGTGDHTMIDHSGAIFVLNAHGELQALFSPPQTPAGLAADVRRLVTPAI